MSNNSIEQAVETVAGSAVGSVASGPFSVAGVIGSLVNKAMDYIPDPAQKIQLQTHALDLQAQASQQELDAVTKQVQASSQASAGDSSLWKVRSVFCYSIVACITFNLILVPLLAAAHMDIAPLNIPTNLLIVFAVIMLGLTAVPTGMAAVRDIMSLPGESSLSILGVKLGNKS